MAQRSKEYREGYKDHDRGVDINQCPYMSGQSFDDWCDGWNDAKMDWEGRDRS